MRNIISKHSSIKPTENDKFNFIRDDIMIKKSYNDITNIKDIEIYKMIFDDLKDDDIDIC